MKKILIVDDSAFTRNIHKQIVSSAGYDTIEAENGKTALSVFQSQHPDLTMIDLLMPDMDGIEVLKQIRVLDPMARVLVCSTDRQKYRQAEAKEAGAAGFFAKPVNAEALIEKIKQVLG
jgi:two-component system chemotaxis response regulator CheY